MSHSFSLGKTVITRGALNHLVTIGLNPVVLLSRHLNLDGGCLCEEDQQMNRMALKTDGRIFSAYMYGGEKLYIVTEWDRSVTTILLSSEY